MLSKAWWLTPVILATQEACQVKAVRPHLNQEKLGVGAHAYHPSYAGSINRIPVQAGLGIKARPYSENNESKKG
jgi:hypothetical protein